MATMLLPCSTSVSYTHLFQVAVGGRHDTHVYFRGFRIPHLYIFPCFEPVSYTHLDVYKRQDRSTTVCRNGLDNILRILRELVTGLHGNTTDSVESTLADFSTVFQVDTGALRLSRKPVSYTHLFPNTFIRLTPILTNRQGDTLHHLPHVFHLVQGSGHQTIVLVLSLLHI